MKRSELEEQIELYLDQELPPAAEKSLRREILRSSESRRLFDEACRYHYAEKVAFSPEDGKFIARQIALLRSRMLHGQSGAGHSGRGRFHPQSIFSHGRSLAVLAAALLALLLVNNSLEIFQGQPVGREALRSEPVAVPSALPGVVPLRERLATVRNSDVEPQSLATAFQLGGLSPVSGDALALSEIEFSLNEEPEAPLLAERAEENRRRLVLVLPRSALPDRSFQRVNSSTGPAGQSGDYLRRGGTVGASTLSYDPSF